MHWSAGQIQLEYTFKRANYLYLPHSYMQRMSRDHAMIRATRKAYMSSSQVLTQRSLTDEELRLAGTLPDDVNLAVKMYGSTIPDTQGDDDEETKCSLDDDGQMNQEQNLRPKFILQDLSLNGTYYIKGRDLLKYKKDGQVVDGDFKYLPKGEEIELEHGDIIAIVVQKPKRKELVFGFQFLEY